MKLSKKAQRLLDFLIQHDEKNNGENPTIGEICKGCKTTTITLLSKTYPELEKYSEKYIELAIGDEDES